jgi:hypothetical protein
MAGTFSESWYRVANLRVALRPTISFRKHNYRGEEWYVLHDPFTGSCFRLSPAYYDFVARLDFSRTVEELWYDTLNADPEQGPGQQDVITLLMELNAANLIYFQDPADCALLFERGLQKKAGSPPALAEYPVYAIPPGKPGFFSHEAASGVAGAVQQMGIGPVACRFGPRVESRHRTCPRNFQSSPEYPGAGQPAAFVPRHCHDQDFS